MSGARRIAPGKARDCQPRGSHLQYLSGRFAPGAQARGEPGQVLIIGAVSLTALLVLTAVVINLGSYFVERRALQNAADAAALAAVGRLAEEHVSRSFRDSVVYQAAMTLALQNQIDVGGTRQLQAIYTDSDGAALGAVGMGSPVPEPARGVRITLSGPFATILSPLLGTASVQAQAEARARLLRAPFPASWANPVPLAVPLAAFDAAASFDLYDTSIAASSYGVAGYEPFLHLAFPGNAGAGYTPADDFSEMHTNLQFWSDGAHQSGALGLGSQVAIAKGPYGPDVRAGLLDNVRRQGLVDGNGASGCGGGKHGRAHVTRPGVWRKPRARRPCPCARPQHCDCRPTH